MYGSSLYAEVGYAQYFPFRGPIPTLPNLGEAIILTISEETAITLNNDDGAIVLG